MVAFDVLLANPDVVSTYVSVGVSVDPPDEYLLMISFANLNNSVVPDAGTTVQISLIYCGTTMVFLVASPVLDAEL
jgi:hypothetical protein